MKIFVDEAAWYSLADENNSLHQAVKEEFQHTLENGDSFYSTNVIIGNVVSRIKEQMGSEKAIRFYNILEEAWLGTHLHILWIGRRTLKDATRLFKKFPDSRMGLFDCANVVLMNRRNIRFVLSENDAYSKMGFKVIPEKEGRSQ